MERNERVRPTIDNRSEAVIVCEIFHIAALSLGEGTANAILPFALFEYLRLRSPLVCEKKE